MLEDNLKSFFPGHPHREVKVPIVYKRKVDRKFVNSIVRCINENMKEFTPLKLDNIVVGLSGGVDSVVSALLMMRSGINTTAIIIELDDANGLSEVTKKSIYLANKIGVDYRVINATNLYLEHLSLLDNNSSIARVHLRSRVITNIIFQYADNTSAVVVDTTDKSEYILCIYEESFRGHIAPIAGLYKSELYDLADLFGFEELRVQRSGCPELIDFDAFGVEWEDLDALLDLIYEQHFDVDKLSKKYYIDRDWLVSLFKRITEQPIRIKVRKFNI